MSPVRCTAVVLLLAASAARPALAASCSVTILGRQVVDDETCDTVDRGGTLTVTQDGVVTAIVRRSVLRANFDGARVRGRRGLASYGLIVKSDGDDDRTCYFNQKITMCVDR